MSLQEHQRRQRQRAASLANPQQSAPIRSPFQKVQSLAAWCASKGISLSTGRRLVKAGKLKLTYLSPRRVGVSEVDDAAYMKACGRNGA
jgi:hypothetical protein